MDYRLVGSSAVGDPEPRDAQQAQLLSVLRSRAGGPVTYSELQRAGIEFPASVVAELELGGFEIERLGSSLQLPANAVAVDPPEPEPVVAADPPRGPRLRGRALAPLALVAGIAAIAGVLVAALSGGKAQPRLAARSHPSSHATAAAPVKTAVRHKASAATVKTRVHHPATASHTLVVPSPSANQTATTPPPSTTVASPAGTVPSTTAASPAVTVPSTTAASPAVTVQRFYEAAAQHQYGTAWALADANLRAQLQGYLSFAHEMSSVRSISFHRAQTADEAADAATVDVATTSVQTDAVQQCAGSVRTVRAGSGWLLDGISISCS